MQGQDLRGSTSPIQAPGLGGEVLRLRREVLELSGEVLRLTHEALNLTHEVLDLSGESRNLDREVLRLRQEHQNLSPESQSLSHEARRLVRERPKGVRGPGRRAPTPYPMARGKESMIKKSCRVAAITFALTALASGCRSTQEYARLAEAGSRYISTIDRLLVARANTRINSTSEELLSLDRLRNLSREDYRLLSEADLDQLDTIGLIRRHNQLLARYLSLINGLATSSAPETAQTSIRDIVANLGAVSARLQPLVARQESIDTFSQLAISTSIRGALRAELAQRKEVIRTELGLQRKLLELLAQQIRADLRDIRVNQEERMVINPLLASEPIAKPDDWIATRRKVLDLEVLAQQLQAASDAASEFESIFEDFVGGRLSTARLNAFLANLESLTSVIQALDQSKETPDVPPVKPRRGAVHRPSSARPENLKKAPE